MVRNEEKHRQAMDLRRRGFTLTEIARYCDIAKSTASLWLKDADFSSQVTKQNKARAGVENAKRLRLVNKARSSERTARYQEAAHSAEVEYRHYKKDPLFIAGLMLYVGEGDTTHPRLLRLTSARLESHRIFIKFVVTYLGADRGKIRFWLLLYANLDVKKCEKTWRKATSLPYSQFHKTQIVQSQSTKSILQSGVGNTIIGNVVLKCKLNTWIDLATKELSK